MKVLIIASGEGRRIRSASSSPKPLIPLLGLSLIERVILTAKKAGFKDFLVVVGYKGDVIKDKLRDGKRYGVKILYIDNPHWKEENGVTVLKAESFIKENFILLMADHILDYRILERLKERADRGNILCVDRNPKDYIDLAEATKVKIKDGKIEEIGKNLSCWDAIDTGVFLLSPKIFPALRKSIERGDSTLSGGIKILAREEGVEAVDVEGKFWIDVDTREDLEKAEKILLAQTGKLTDGFISRNINRPLSRRITKILISTTLTPNMVSFLSFVVCVVSSLFLAIGNYWGFLVGGIFAQVASILDGCDGEIATLKFQESEYGAWFDASLDRYADALILLGMSIGEFKITANVGIWIAGFFALIGSFMNSYTATKYDSIFKFKRKRMFFRLGRDTRLFLIMVGCFINQIYFTLIVLAFLTNIESLRRLYIVRRWIEIAG